MFFKSIAWYSLKSSISQAGRTEVFVKRTILNRRFQQVLAEFVVQPATGENGNGGLNPPFHSTNQPCHLYLKPTIKYISVEVVILVV